jgi:hypothetical protein
MNFKFFKNEKQPKMKHGSLHNSSNNNNSWQKRKQETNIETVAK